LELVGAALGDGVDAGAGEAALAHVEGRDGHLYLRDGVEGHGLGVGLPARRGIVEPEGVAEVRSVEGDAVVQPVLPREGKVAVAARIETGEVAGAALDR